MLRPPRTGELKRLHSRAQTDVEKGGGPSWLPSAEQGAHSRVGTRSWTPSLPEHAPVWGKEEDTGGTHALIPTLQK